MSISELEVASRYTIRFRPDGGGRDKNWNVAVITKTPGYLTVYSYQTGRLEDIRTDTIMEIKPYVIERA